MNINNEQMSTDNEKINPLPPLNINALNYDFMKSLMKFSVGFLTASTLVVDLFWILLNGIQYGIQYVLLAIFNVAMISGYVLYYTFLKKIGNSPSKAFLYMGIVFLAIEVEILILFVFFNLKNSIDLCVLHYVIIVLGCAFNIVLAARKHWIYKVGRFKMKKSNNNYGSPALAVVMVSILLPIYRRFKQNADIALSVCFLLLFFLLLIMPFIFLHNYYIACKENIGIK